MKRVEVHKDNEGVCRGAYKCLSFLGDDQQMNKNRTGHYSSRRSSTTTNSSNNNTLSRRRQKRKSRRMKDGDVTSDEEESRHSSRHGRYSSSSGSSEEDNGTVGQQRVVQRVNSMDIDGSARSAVSSRSAMSLTPLDDSYVSLRRLHGVHTQDFPFRGFRFIRSSRGCYLGWIMYLLTIICPIDIFFNNNRVNELL